jgi:chromosome segregation ATPase
MAAVGKAVSELLSREEERAIRERPRSLEGTEGPIQAGGDVDKLLSALDAIRAERDHLAEFKEREEENMRQLESDFKQALKELAAAQLDAQRLREVLAKVRWLLDLLADRGLIPEQIMMDGGYDFVGDALNQPTSYAALQEYVRAEVEKATKALKRKIRALQDCDMVPCKAKLLLALDPNYEASEQEAAPDACAHQRLNEDGICRQCGEDRRGA